jgi:hypothetical protein
LKVFCEVYISLVVCSAAALERTRKTNVNVTNTQKPNNEITVDDNDESLALAIKLSLNQT